MDLASSLQNAQNPDQTIRNKAEMELNQAAEQHYVPFVMALCSELSTEGRNDYNRQLAGLYLKNLITAQDASMREAKESRWNAVEHVHKEQIRNMCLQGILSQVRVVSHTAAQVVAAFGSVDVQQKQWPNLLETILNYVSAPEVHLVAKLSALECLGYMCDEMDPSYVDKPVVDQILNTIVGALQADKPTEMKKAAVTALLNSLDFTAKNFDIPGERNAIMSVLCTAVQDSDIHVRIKAFECIATVADLYYTYLPDYITPLFSLTGNAIKNDDETVGLQAIEFWSTICDMECEIVQHIESGPHQGITYLRIIEQVSPALIPLLLETLVKQDEDNDDEDVWNISKGGATCLDIIAQTIQDKIVELILPFITSNVASADWHFKEASIMAFGSIMDGPSPDILIPIITSALPVLIGNLKDNSKIVRGTTAWTIGRICDFQSSVITDAMLTPLFTVLLEALDDPVVTVVVQGCYAIHSLSDHCGDSGNEPKQTNALSMFLPRMIEKLLEVSIRNVGNELNNLRVTAYVAINNMIMNSALDMNGAIKVVLTEGLGRLETTFNVQLDHHEKTALQGHLCGMIGSCVQKLTGDDVKIVSDRIMTVLLQVVNIPQSIAHRDAFMCVGYIADKLSADFSRYIEYVMPVVINALKIVEDYELITIVVGTVGDFCRALTKNIAQYCDDIVRNLLDLLQSQALNRAAKPHVLALFSDIAMAIGAGFERYVHVVMVMLQNAGELTVVGDDEDMVDYINSLRECILEAYTGIVQGLSDDEKQEVLIPYMEGVALFVHRCAIDSTKNTAVLRSTIGLIGDLGQIFSNKMQAFVNQSYIDELIQSGIEDEEVEGVATWTLEIVSKIRQNQPTR